MKPGYADTLHQLLSVYRFLAYGLAVVLIQVLPISQGQDVDRDTLVVLSLLGVYTFLKVFSPVRWRETSLATYVVLGGDVVVAILLLFFTAGLDSGYIFYSLLPLATASLLFPERVAWTVAGLTVATPLIVHTLGSLLSDRHAWILDGNHLPLLLLYGAVCLLIATMAYHTNVNIRRRFVQEAMQDERQRTRRELHDGVAQSLNYVRLQTQEIANSLASQSHAKALQGLEELQAVVRATYEDIREAIDQFSTDAMTRPFLPALAEYVQEFSRRTVIPVEFQAPENLRGLPPEAQLQLLRIAQEALTNVRKHTQASRVWVTVTETPEAVRLVVKDNGQGFTAGDGQEGQAPESHGLAVMKERAQELGGVIEIQSLPGEGTELSVTVPREKVRH